MTPTRRSAFLFALLSIFTTLPCAAVSPALAHSSRHDASAVLDAVAADQLRIRAHLERVERELRARDTSSLAPSARFLRARALDALHGYFRRGVFPRNTRHPGERVPYFIDDEGRACAMAHLIQASGASALAETVRARENNARVRAMTTHLGPWLEENGLSVEEAARVQPDYCFCGDVYNPVCAEVPADGGVEPRTFMNECIATLCGDTNVIHDGECKPGDELAEPTCSEDGGVCSGEPSGCSLGLAPGRHGPLGLAPAVGTGLLGLFVGLRRRARRRARR